MNRKLFAVTVMACLAGLGAAATQSRQQASRVADKLVPVAPTVETTVVQRTEYVHRRVHRAKRHASASGSGGGRSTTSTPVVPATQRQVTVSPAPAPRPTTSPSATGGQGGENEAEHEVENHDNGAESEREDD
ncbi:MAG: hypothetical protein ACRDKI_02635 [Solirubrobacterales bacterium]